MNDLGKISVTPICGVLGYLLDTFFYHKHKAIYDSFTNLWYKLSAINVKSAISKACNNSLKGTDKIFGRKLFSLRSTAATIIIGIISVVVFTLCQFPQLPTIMALKLSLLPCVFSIPVCLISTWLTRLLLRLVNIRNNIIALLAVIVVDLIGIILVCVFFYYLLGWVTASYIKLAYDIKQPSEKAAVVVGAIALVSVLYIPQAIMGVSVILLLHVGFVISLLAFHISGKFILRIAAHHLAREVEHPTYMPFTSVGAALGGLYTIIALLFGHLPVSTLYYKAWGNTIPMFLHATAIGTEQATRFFVSSTSDPKCTAYYNEVATFMSMYAKDMTRSADLTSSELHKDILKLKETINSGTNSTSTKLDK